MPLPVFLRKKVKTDFSGLSFSREIIPWTVGALANVYDTVLATTPEYSMFGNSASQVTGRMQITGPTFNVPQGGPHIAVGGTTAESLYLQGLVNESPQVPVDELVVE